MNKPNRWHMSFNIMLFTLLYLGCITLGYVLASLLFQVTGKPAELLSYLISVIMGLLLSIVAARLFTIVFSRTKYGQEHNLRRHQFLDKTLEALNKISRGDFNISIAINEIHL